MHIDEDLVGILELGETLHFHPEIGVLHAGDIRDEAAFLEIAARERAVEIVDNGGAERLRLAVGGIRHGDGLRGVGLQSQTLRERSQWRRPSDPTVGYCAGCSRARANPQAA
jgi:hypothetical protein